MRWRNKRSLAEAVGDPLLVALDHWYLGFISFVMGEFTTAQTHLDQIIAFHKPQQHHYPLVSLRGSDAGVSALAYEACYLWCLGYPDRAQKQSREALALVQELNHRFSLADVVCFAGCWLNMMRRDAPPVKVHAEELIRLASQGPWTSWLETGICFRGRALALMGQAEEGMAEMREGLRVALAKGIRLGMTGVLGSMAEAQGKTGRPEEGLATLEKACSLVEQTGERFSEAELYRLRAELLLMQGDEEQAEGSLLTAIEIARRQQAKSWELRAAVDLSRLWQRQSKQEQARELLAEVYGWFTEGFETADLRAARALMSELTSESRTAEGAPVP